MNISYCLVFIAVILWMLLCFHSYAQNTNLQNENHTTKSIPFSISNKTPIVNVAGTCGDMGAENGWGLWQASVGYYQGGVITFVSTGIAPTAPRFNLTSGAGIDPCTPGGGGPSVPVVAPGFGNASIQLGQPGTDGINGGCSNNPPYPAPLPGYAGNGCVEQLKYPLLVTTADTNFVFAYAIVLEDPQPAHTGKDVPYAEIYILDQNGDTVKCSHHKYSGDTSGTAAIPPGMYAASCAGSVNAGVANGFDVAYRPWRTVGINLVSYINQTVTVVITNTDCGRGGHYCYSYWDFNCPPLSGATFPFCLGQQTTIVGPPSTPDNPYTYQWYQNGHPYTGLPNATSQSITPTPLAKDTFSIHVFQNSGCSFWVPFAPQPTTIIPDFTHTGACGNMTFTDISTVSPVSPTDTVAAWNWQFPGGTPTNSTAQNPGIIFYPPGTYTVTLIVTSSAGCTDSIKYPFTVGGFPTAAFQPTSPCLGALTTLTDGSVSHQGDPITSWNWSMPGGIPSSSTAQNTTTTYNTAGTHSVTLVVTSQQGCKDTIVQQVLVYRPPVALFNDMDSGCAPVCHTFHDLSTSIDGTITNWVWSFPGGSPNLSLQTNPGPICYNTPGSYNGSIIVTTNYGCKDTFQLNNIIHVYSWPKADFCVTPDQAPTTDPVFNFCPLWTPNPGVTNWIWNFGDTSSLDSINTNPVHSYSATVTGNDFYSYNVCLKVQNQFGCWDTICKPVEITPYFTFYIPNCVTPNGDNNNEIFFGKGRGIKDYNIWIFDRWGNQIWDCHYNGKNTDWDGNGQDGMSAACKWDCIVVPGGMDMNGNSGQLVQEDVYVWKVKLTDVFNKVHDYIGHVTVVK